MDEGLSEKYGFGDAVKSDLTLYAGWKEKEKEPEAGSDFEKPEKHRVTFESNGGSVIDPVEVEDGGQLAEPEKPVRDGFEFAGWYLDGELKEKYDFSGSVKSDLMLYAGWTEKEETSEPTPEPGQEPGSEPESTPELGQEPESEPESTPESGQEPELTPEPRPELGQKPESVPELIPEVGSEPRPTPEPIPELGQGLGETPELMPEPDSMPVSEPGSRPEFIPEQSIIPMQEPEVNPAGLSKEGRRMDKLLPVAAAVAVGAGGSGGFCFFWFFRRRRVIGTVMDVDGNGMEGIRVLLDGRRLETNSRGEFRFHGMRRGNHSLCIFDGREKEVLVMDIFTDAAEDREIFTVLEDDTVRTDAHRESKKYFVDVVMA